MRYRKPQLLEVKPRSDDDCEAGGGYNCQNGGNPRGACVVGAKI